MRQRQVHSVGATLVAVLLVAGGTLSAQPLAITHLAGATDGGGWSDGSGSEARFASPRGVAVDGSGNVYVADSGNYTVRKVTAAGVSSTLAGLPGSRGTADGTGSAARFSGPWGVAVDGSGNVYVADFVYSTLRKVSATGIVSTLAGLPGVRGNADGTGTAARFQTPRGVAVDGSGNVYVADTDSNTIRRVTPAGVVSTLAGLAGSSGSADGSGSSARFSGPAGVAVDSSENVYVADTNNHAIRKITPSGAVSTLAGLAGSRGSADGVGSAARFENPTSVAVDAPGNVYVADFSNNTIRKVNPAGVVSTLAGRPGSWGPTDGTGSSARFLGPYGVAVDASGNVYVADTSNNEIRKVTSAGVVTTLAGSVGASGSADGSGSAARFYSPTGVAVAASGDTYVADFRNDTIRKVTSAGVVSTFAGLAGSFGSADGTGSAARFYHPRGIAIDGSGNLYVTDNWNHTVRKVTPSGIVSTLAGLARNAGSADGTGSAARFYYPSGVAVDDVGNVYVTEWANNTVRKVTPGGVVSTIAGVAGTQGSTDGAGSAALFRSPEGVAADGAGNVFVADAGNATIRRISPTGVVSTLAGAVGQFDWVDGTGSQARFGQLVGLAADRSGNLFVVEREANVLRRVTPSGVVSTPAGRAGSVGCDDGIGSAARFAVPEGVAVDGSGNLFVADTGNNAIRKGSLATWGFVPVVLDVEGFAHYTSELQLTNLGGDAATVSLTYTSSIGSGTGETTETVPAGQQLVFPDALSHLRARGIPIPTSENQVGTLLLSAPAAGVRATVRTGADTAAPQPVGRAGLAYTDSGPEGSSVSARLYVHGLRTNDADRSNLAVYNMGQDPVSLHVTVVSGNDGRAFGIPAETLPAYGWRQYTGILGSAGVSSGYAIVQRVAGRGPFGAYGVVNDQRTNDGSFIPALPAAPSGSRLTVPVLVEAGSFESELILANRGSATATFSLRYVESLSPARGTGGTAALAVGPGVQAIIPSAIDYLRSRQVHVGPRGEAGYAGSLQIQVSGVDLENVFAGARTSARSPAGGQFGLFYPAVHSSEEASDTAFILGLKAGVNDRSNVAVLHTGDPDSGPITLDLQVLDGSDGGNPVGQPLSVILSPGQWAQPPGLFASGGVPNGYVRIRRTAGTAPWYAYGVVNDGGAPDRRTGDGAYVPMVK